MVLKISYERLASITESTSNYAVEIVLNCILYVTVINFSSIHKVSECLLNLKLTPRIADSTRRSKSSSSLNN